jgi:hypothetical protein
MIFPRMLSHREIGVVYRTFTWPRPGRRLTTQLAEREKNAQRTIFRLLGKLPI